MASVDLSELRIDDQAFLIASTIDRCPKVMMIRELFKNALEAAEQVVSGKGKVEFSITIINEVPKLTIWNNGPGMDEEELIRMTNLAASIGKEKALDKNFGMGAKVASLPSNHQGIRYRSCKDGFVHEVILCKRNGVYGRLKRWDKDGELLGDCIDVTEQIRKEGRRPLDSEWTEVVLYGNESRQNTAVDPYDGDPPQPKFWLATYLYHRFYRIPRNVEVRMSEGTHARQEGSRKFETIPDRSKFFKQTESVTLGSGITVHYIYDEALKDTAHNRSVSGSIASDVSTCGVIFKDEIYAILTGRNWTIEAPVFGIPFGAKHISIHIELPHDYRVLPEGYRQFLRHSDGEQAQVDASEFAHLVLENRPKWLVELIHSLAPHTGDSSEEIRKKLQEILNQLRVTARTPRLDKEGDIEVDEASGRGARPFASRTRQGELGNANKPIDLAIASSGSHAARMMQNLERAPKLIPLDDEAEIEEKNIRGRAGRYYLKTGELFINMTYPAVELMRQHLEREYVHAPEVEVMRKLALEFARNYMIQRVGLAVVFALAKRLNKEWDEEAMGKALEPESLSLAADNYFDSLQNARRAIGTKLRTKRTDVELVSLDD